MTPAQRRRAVELLERARPQTTPWLRAEIGQLLRSLAATPVVYEGPAVEAQS